MNTIAFLRLLSDQQRYTELEDACRKALSASPDAAVYPLLALACAHQGNSAAAGKALCRATAPDVFERLDFEARLDLAAARLALSQIDEAQELLEALLARQPDHPLALARHGLCLMAQGETQGARGQLARSAALDPSRVAVFTNLAALALQADDAEAAQTAIDQGKKALIDGRDKMSDAFLDNHRQQFGLLQLECWCAMEAFAEAEAWLGGKRAEADEDRYLFWLVGYANALAQRGRHAQAMEMLREGLKHYPENIRLLVQGAELALMQGHLMEAVRALRRAIGFDTENPTLWCKLSNACLQRFSRQARKAAEKAVELVEQLQEGNGQPLPQINMLQAQAKTALAQVECQEQHYALSERLFRDVLVLTPSFVPALQGLGQQFMQQGRIDEALQQYDQIKTVDPLNAHSALINARVFPEDVETLEKMERMARLPTTGGWGRSGIFFQLAAAWEKRKDYTKAFELAREANAASRRFLAYDAKVHRNRCARIRHAFSQALYWHRKDCGVDSNLPVYVLGMPRSGTTLVEQIIAGHSQIFSAGELGVIPQRIAGLNHWERHVGSGRHYPDCIDDLPPRASQEIAREILKELSDLASDSKPGARHVVDKLPHNFENIGLIKFLFPKAKIISVRRDPRDIAISNFFTDYQAKHGGMGFAYDLTDIGEQLADHNLLMHHWHQVFPGEILEINYEDVVDDLETSARKMLDYIGVAWEPRVLGFNELERPVKTASLWQVRQPIYKTSKARWTRYQVHLAPLIKGTNAKIVWDPIEDMLTLPEPGFLQTGVDCFHRGDLDQAELCFKKMLHHNPDHAACNYMVGLVYCRKGYLTDAIELFEKALEICPWHKEWRDNLRNAYLQTGQSAKAADIQRMGEKADGRQTWSDRDEDAWAHEHPASMAPTGF